MVSIQVLATPMMGLARSSSVNPMPLSMARAGARSRPCVMVWLRSCMEASLAEKPALLDFPKSVAQDRARAHHGFVPRRAYAIMLVFTSLVGCQKTPRER